MNGGHHNRDKARVLIMSECLSGLEIIEMKVLTGEKNVYRRIQNGAVLEAITNVRETLGTVIFMWIPSHVGIVPDITADSMATKEHGKAPDGMITGLLSKQVKSRPLICGRKVQGSIELADGPIYREARKRGEKVIRDMHTHPEGGDKCELAKGRWQRACWTEMGSRGEKAPMGKLT
eukprot:4685256-Pleurochrysis_carterae.AAC.2